METIFDWISVIIFSGLIVLFLQRSTEAVPRDHLWQYLVPSAGCAVANYLGNEVNSLLAFAAIAAVLGFIAYVLRPF